AGVAWTAAANAGVGGGFTADGGPASVVAGAAAVTVGGARAAGAAGGAVACAGSRPSGSTYPCGSLVRRTPTWTIGVPPAPGSPIAPTLSPSATGAPFFTPIEPSWVSVTDQPSTVSIVTDRPLPGTVPANETTPGAGARTGSPTAPATSTTRCWPAA